MTAPATATGAVARADTAETLALGPDSMRLLLDADATGGAVSAHCAHLTDGALGATPHRHTISSEVFYVVDGSLDVLVGEDLVRMTSGDLAVAPPGVTHAFAASPGCDAEVFVFITPGVQRFDFFRQVSLVLSGEVDRGALMDMQADFDIVPVENPNWRIPNAGCVAKSLDPCPSSSAGRLAGATGRQLRPSGLS
jgi:mannose-6-phosphate isomerase-like protein (cupin superfamily)